MIKIVALDVYETILAMDGDDSYPPKQGLETYPDKCDELKINVVTSSVEPSF